MSDRGRAGIVSFGTAFGALVRVAAVVAALLVAHAVAAQPRPFREYPGFEGAASAAPLPEDWQVPGELVVGRLMYPNGGRGGFGRFGGDWRQGGTSWTDDYPKGDRLLVQMLRRLSRANVRAVEQPVNPDDGDDIDYWPFMLVGSRPRGTSRTNRPRISANTCCAAGSCSATASSAIGTGRDSRRA